MMKNLHIFVFLLFYQKYMNKSLIICERFVNFLKVDRGVERDLIERCGVLGLREVRKCRGLGVCVALVLHRISGLCRITKSITHPRLFFVQYATYHTIIRVIVNMHKGYMHGKFWKFSKTSRKWDFSRITWSVCVCITKKHYIAQK